MVYKHARKIMFSGGLTQAEVLLKKSPVEKPEPELPDYLNGETEV